LAVVLRPIEGKPTVRRLLAFAALAATVIIGVYAAAAATTSSVAASTPAGCATHQTLVTDSSGRVIGILVPGGSDPRLVGGTVPSGGFAASRNTAETIASRLIAHG
jgi:hypothetical protein